MSHEQIQRAENAIAGEIYREGTGVAGNKKLITTAIDTLVDAYADRKLELEAAQLVVDECQKSLDAAQEELFAALEAQGLRAVRTPRGLFTLNDLAWAKVVDAQLVRQWAEEQMPEVIGFNHQRLAVVVREKLRGGEELPPGLDFTTSRKVTWRRQ